MELNTVACVDPSAAVDAILEGEHWLASLDTHECYTRRHDDTNGEVGPAQELSVTFGPDGDAWLVLAAASSLRFRTHSGGGHSLRVRKALMVLAEAIRRDNAEYPQDMGPSAAGG